MAKSTNLDPLLHPKSVAVIGASQDVNKLVGKPVHFLLRHKYQGKIYPINPKYREISGLTCYPDLKRIPGDIDAAIIGLPAQNVFPAMQACVQRRVKAVVIFASGFGEVGGTGAKMEQDLLDLARNSGVLLCGPNCQGVVNLREGATLSFTPALEREVLLPGSIAFITQSGAMGGSLFSNALQMGIGFSYWISSGNETALESADYLEYLIPDPSTRVFLSYMEGFKDSAKWIHAAQSAREARKPIVAIRAGRTETGKRAVQSHTGALSGPDEEMEALFQEMGILRAGDVDEFLDLGNILAQGRFPKGRGIAIISTSGGAGALIADYCELSGLEVPFLREDTQRDIQELIPSYGSACNPVDITAMFAQKIAAGEIGHFKRFFQALSREEKVHSIIVMLTMVTGEIARKVAQDIVAVYQETELPIVVSWIAGNLAEEGYAILRQAGVPLYMNTKRGVQAIRALVQYSEFLRKQES